MPVIEDILSKREQIISVTTQYKIHNVKLFGSILREEETREGDIDFLVECQDDCSLFDIISLRYALEEFLGRQVDIVTHDSLHWTLKDRILLEARPI
ncbi:nucleotidyltransferase domain-containing protein [Desulfosporosinus sp.]|uniref:nucleotidyltransferase family protein n=1 Tax=Desulfosporosinus sp. TaxID=157907 RepID=UPI00232803CC|nr:nucleotidyltransferase domain-containing protein [Desulfosporosinus sp.]MCO5385206.1 nucleotidyltransferase domain-containing protein [Desulfosporosinus sp.]MDA8222931.1 nucleotidyltransferase domain-containing protein [Desulfitobacterium hafniense]